MRTYLVSLHNHPEPSNEIDEIVWLNQDYENSGYQFASILGKQILPKLFPRGGK
jgi:8-oxo-dGTP diphosphatase